MVLISMQSKYNLFQNRQKLEINYKFIINKIILYSINKLSEYI
jgi:hypothetical protein